MVPVTGPTKAEDEVVDLVSALIRFDTTNTGELETTKGEAECARWVAEQLEQVGYDTEQVESGAPGRANGFARLRGSGYVLARGQIDMKNMVGMMIAVARHFKRDGIVPPRDLGFAFVADEE